MIAGQLSIRNVDTHVRLIQEFHPSSSIHTDINNVRMRTGMQAEALAYLSVPQTDACPSLLTCHTFSPLHIHQDTFTYILYHKFGE